jgi:hypothetical protein
MTTAAAPAKGSTGSESATTTTPATGETPATGTTTAATGTTTPAAGETTATSTTAPPAGSTPGQAPPASTAPATYALTLPEGGRLDAQDLAAIEAVARQVGWTNAEAQQRVAEEAQRLEVQSTRFQEATKTDADYGGTHFDETLVHANAALDLLRPKGTPHGDALRALLHKSGYGNHLEVVSLLADLGKLMAEDGTVRASGGGETKDAATLLYPNQKA